MRPAVGENYILYNNRYYSLTEHRLAYRRDKSKDESFFLLTLFGVAYELLATDVYAPGQTASVDLLIGLPPACAAANRQESFAPFRTYGLHGGRREGDAPGGRPGRHLRCDRCVPDMR